ncbi:hypothetical protein E4U15_005142 [Claviceps sp. LM218 group G6]|nr:hypothetical protein E4U15_005142 [Claviceps sp. LM218 group G6]
MPGLRLRTLCAEHLSDAYRVGKKLKESSLTNLSSVLSRPKRGNLLIRFPSSEPPATAHGPRPTAHGIYAATAYG